MYYLTITAKRRNAKRHIVEKSDDIDYLRFLGGHLADKYIREIYTGGWQKVEEIV